MYYIQHCFICRPSDSTVSEDAEIEPRTVATSALAVRRSNHSAIDLNHIPSHHILSIPVWSPVELSAGRGGRAWGGAKSKKYGHL